MPLAPVLPLQPILVADDDQNQAYITLRAFKDAGVRHPLTVVADGDAAIDYLRGEAAYLLGANGYLVKPLSYDATLTMARAIKDYWLTVNRAPLPSPR